MKKKTTFFLCLLCAGVSSSYAQDLGPKTLNASGGSKTIGGNTYEYSIGEMTLVNTATASNIIVTQGVLQPMPAAVIVGVQNPAFFADNFKIFPNPSNQIIFLQPAFSHGGKLSFHLYDALGRILKQGTFTLNTGTEKQSIDLSDLASSSYALDITFEQLGKIYNTSYKIQKIN
jgi:hypothetical protein